MESGSGTRVGKARIAQRGSGLDLGLFSLAGSHRRLIALTRDGQCFESLASGRPIEDAVWGFPTKDGVKTLIEEGLCTEFRWGTSQKEGSRRFYTFLPRM